MSDIDNIDDLSEPQIVGAQTNTTVDRDAVNYTEPMSLHGQFLIKEYEFLATTKLGIVAERRRIESYTILSNAAIYTWIFALSKPVDRHFLHFALVIPVLICVFGSLRYFGLQFQLRNIVDYQQSIEEEVCGNQHGWERFIERRRQRGNPIDRLESWSEIVAWVVSMFVTASVATWLW